MPKRRSALSIVIGLTLAVFLAVVIARIIWTPYLIPAGSMKPTLLVGDYVTTKRLNAQPMRGDIIVFRHPVLGSTFVKRLVGLPGDEIQMKAGILHINGDAVGLEPDGDFAEAMERQGPFASLPRCENGHVDIDGECLKSRQIETLPGGRMHAVLNIADQPLDNTDLFKVPQGHYFFLGDNRDNSADSRIPAANRGLGFVPAGKLTGKVDRVIFSSAGRSPLFFWTWRGDRLFTRVE